MTTPPSTAPESATANSGAGARSFSATARPTILGARGMVSTGHYLASNAAAEVLMRGGNAVDAGVAAGFCLNVVHTDMNTFSGVAPIMISIAGQTRSVAGIGRWPEAIDRDLLIEQHRGIPDSLLRCVVPAAPDAWLSALRAYGTMSFGDVSSAARRYAAEGFPVHTFMRHAIESFLHVYRRHPENARLYLRDGEPPAVGDVVVQRELAATLAGLVDIETNATGSRESRIDAVLDHIYRGPIAARMVEYVGQHGGVLSTSDMATFACVHEEPLRVRFHDIEVAVCGPWSQGPAFGMALSILRNVDLRSLGHNSATYVNTVASALDLAFADRNTHLGDPEFIDVPPEALLSLAYGALRSSLLPSGPTAWSTPAAPGEPRSMRAEAAELARGREDFGAPAAKPPGDTSCVTVIDGDGNVFAATPSDGYSGGPVIPGLGLHVSERGSQSFLDAADPNCVAPRKRPRLMPNPVLIFRDGVPTMAMASPGNDRQVQAMLQVLLNVEIFGMTPQEAVESPRFASYNFRASSWPGNVEPGRVCLEDGIAPEVGRDLAAWGRDSDGGRPGAGLQVACASRWCCPTVCAQGLQTPDARAMRSEPRRSWHA